MSFLSLALLIIVQALNTYDYGSTYYVFHKYPLEAEERNPFVKKAVSFFHTSVIRFGLVYKTALAGVFLWFYLLAPTSSLEEFGLIVFICILLMPTIHNTYYLLKGPAN